MKAKQMESYLLDNYGVVRHDTGKMEYACIQLANDLKVKPEEIFFFMVENEPIEGLYTHSYGFNTRQGRGIKESFESYYYDS